MGVSWLVSYNRCMENKLHHLSEFRKVLADYRMSAESQKILNETELALFVAPTSGGRNTIFRELLKTDLYHYVVSDTTRQPRVNDGIPEQNGVEYWFKSEEEMLASLEAGEYLEAAIIHNQHVSGISIKELEKAHASNKIAMKDIEIIGAETFMKAKPDTIVFFVLPPNFEEWQRRLKHRGQMSHDELKRRMESAAEEYAHALQHKYYDFLINDTVDEALEHVYIRTVLGFRDLIHQVRGRRLCEQLYMETQAFLKTL